MPDPALTITPSTLALVERLFQGEVARLDLRPGAPTFLTVHLEDGSTREYASAAPEAALRQAAEAFAPGAGPVVLDENPLRRERTLEEL